MHNLLGLVNIEGFRFAGGEKHGLKSSGRLAIQTMMPPSPLHYPTTTITKVPFAAVHSSDGGPSTITLAVLSSS